MNIEHYKILIGQVHFDLLHVIAYGPTVAKVAAANLLFLYWPSLNPTPAERKVSRAGELWDEMPPY